MQSVLAEQIILSPTAQTRSTTSRSHNLAPDSAALNKRKGVSF